MTYQELIDQVRKGRSVRATAAALGMPYTTFFRYVKGTRFPDIDAALRMAEEAGIDPAGAYAAIAEAQRQYRKSL